MRDLPLKNQEQHFACLVQTELGRLHGLTMSFQNVLVLHSQGAMRREQNHLNALGRNGYSVE